MSRHRPLTADEPHRHDPVLRFKKGDAVYHAVRRSILLGHIAPGAQLLEQGIAERLHCSQGTVREALLRLEQDGLVERRGYRGTVVSATSVQETAQMAEIRLQIECAGIRRSVARLADTVVAQLLNITRAMDEAVAEADFYRCSELDRDFHQTLFGAAELPALEPILNRCTLHVHRFTFWNAEAEAPEPSFGDQHRALLEVFRTGDADAAAEAIRQHIEAVIERFAEPVGREMRRIQG